MVCTPSPLITSLILENKPSSVDNSAAVVDPEKKMLQDDDYTLVQLSAEETLVEFSEGSKANPVNWNFVSLVITNYDSDDATKN